MEKVKVPWKVATKVWWSITWRGALISTAPGFLIGIVVSLSGDAAVVKAGPILGIFVMAYFYWGWVAAVKVVMEKYGFLIGHGRQGGEQHDVSASTDRGAIMQSGQSPFRLLVIVLDVAWIGTVIYLFSDTNPKSAKDIGLALLFFAAPVATLLSFYLEREESWLSLYFKRKALEERKKIERMNNDKA